MKEEKITTLHPEGKNGVTISIEKYEKIKEEILRHLNSNALTYSELVEEIKQTINNFDGSIEWYTVSVKLDLEARGIIRRVPGTRPEKVELLKG